MNDARATGPATPADYLRLVRPLHWVKSLLVFVPLVTSHSLNAQSFRAACLAFAAFSLASSSGYAVNDLADAEDARPVASGAVSKRAAALVALALGFAALALSAFVLPEGFLWPVAMYLLLTVVYSAYIKRLFLLDVLALTALYNLRVFGGAVAIGVSVSSWLLAFGMFFFTSIAFAKRYIELRKLIEEPAGEGEKRAPRRAYQAEDLAIFLSSGPASGYLAVLVLAMYADSATVRSMYSQPLFLWLFCPLLFYWVTRVWFLAHRGRLQYDPVAFVLRDPPSWCVFALGVAVLAAAL